ncbi:MAG TPA: Asp23/Gls24 family envelope stress response protein [Clostridiales bacterium]|nr:Asp23/Gls24 family envelope stress response protein [Clostridiales bacterium]
MSILINSSLGEVSVDNNVVASIAGAVATKCYGVVGMAAKNKKDGVIRLLKRDNMSRGISVSVSENGIVIDLHIIVEYGVNINAICDSIVHNVQYQLEHNTGLKVTKVNVLVESVRVKE